jgi:tRNA(Ile)-lysidine synthase
VSGVRIPAPLPFLTASPVRLPARTSGQARLFRPATSPSPFGDIPVLKRAARKAVYSVGAAKFAAQDLGASVSSDVLEKLRAWNDRHGFEPNGARVLAGVSGGADSMALLHALREAGCAAEAAHVDHGTRDGASAADAAFVRERCEALGVPLHETAIDVPALAADSPLSFEEMARKMRYDFFARTAEAAGIGVVATAHHADDQVETVVMRFLRGTSPHGLAGIPPVSKLGGLRLIRPLLQVTRDEIEAYLRECGVTYREDESNRDPAYLRNRIRHALLPLLETEYNRGARAAVERLADIQRAEDELLQTFTESFLKRCIREERTFDRKAFAAGHRALQRRAVLAMAIRHGVHPDFPRVDAAVDFVLHAKARQRFDLGNGMQLAAGKDGVAVVPMNPDPRDDREVTLPVPGEAEAFGRTYTARLLDRLPEEALSSYCHPERQVFDAERAGDTLLLRHRREGDRFSPLGMSGTRKLKDYLRDAGVPPEERDRIVVLVGNGEILWVVGGAAARAAAVTDDTCRVLEVEVQQ